MRDAAARWLETTEAKVLIDVPLANPPGDGLRNRIERAYAAGYADGRKDGSN